MFIAYYVIASISLFFVCDGVTNQNSYTAHAIVLTNDTTPTTDDKRIRNNRDPIKFDDENIVQYPVKFMEQEFSGPSSNQIEFFDEIEDTQNVVFQDGSRPDVNDVTNQLDTLREKETKPFKFTDSISPVNTNKRNNTGRLIFSDDLRPSISASDNVGFKNTSFPESNVNAGEMTQIVFQDDQGVGGSNSQLHQGSQTSQSFSQKKRRRRRRRRPRQFYPGTYGLQTYGPAAGIKEPVAADNKYLSLAQDMLTMIVDNDKKKCSLRMFCEQAHELKTQPQDTVNYLRTAIFSIADVFKFIPVLEDRFGLNVGKLGSALKQFAEAGSTGKTKGVLACREACPECPSDPVELANYLISFQGLFRRLYNGGNFIMHNQSSPNELGMNGYHPYQQNYGLYYPQSYQPSYQQSYESNYQQSYQPNYQQSYQPNYQQSYLSSHQQSYQPSYLQSYQSNNQQNYQ